MIVLFTDFGADDIYVGQIKAMLLEHLPHGADIVELLHNVPNFHIRAGAHLLAALQDQFPVGSICLTVVDPDVGTDRDAVILPALSSAGGAAAPDRGRRYREGNDLELRLLRVDPGRQGAGIAITCLLRARKAISKSSCAKHHRARD